MKHISSLLIISFVVLLTMISCGASKKELKEKILEIYSHSADNLPSYPEAFSNPDVVQSRFQDFSEYCRKRVRSDKKLSDFFYKKLTKELKKDDPQFELYDDFMNVQVMMKISELLDFDKAETIQLAGYLNKFLGN
jgi:hypothetical protein